MTAFPLTLAQFWTTLGVERLDPALPEVAEVSQTAGGEIVGSSLGDRLWHARVQVRRRSIDQHRSLQGLLRMLRGVDASFLVTPLEARAPYSDPGGTVAGSPVTVASVGTSRTTLAFTGMPAFFVVTGGDYFSIDVGGVKYFHQIVFGATADGTGLTGQMDVVPPLPMSIIAGAAVTLVDPVFKAKMVDGSVSEGSMERSKLSGVSFDLVQTLK